MLFLSVVSDHKSILLSYEASDTNFAKYVLIAHKIQL